MWKPVDGKRACNDNNNNNNNDSNLYLYFFWANLPKSTSAVLTWETCQVAMPCAFSLRDHANRRPRGPITFGFGFARTDRRPSVVRPRRRVSHTNTAADNNSTAWGAFIAVRFVPAAVAICFADEVINRCRPRLHSATRTQSRHRLTQSLPPRRLTSGRVPRPRPVTI